MAERGDLRLGRYGTFLIVLAALAAAPASARVSEDFEAWFRAAWARAGVGIDIDGFALHYRVELPSPLTTGDVERLEAEVRDKPDHPRRRELDSALRQRSKGVDASAYTVWSDGARWRLNSTPTYLASSFFFDAASAGSVVWSLTPEDLVLAGADGDAPAGRQPRLVEQEMRTHVNLLLHAGLNSDPAGTLKAERVEVQGERWRVTARSDSGLVVEYAGSWSPAESRGTVATRSIVATAPGGEAWVGSRDEFADWRVDPVTGRWMPGSVRRVDADGRSRTRLVIERFEPVSRERFEAVVTPPALDGMDPVRGAVTVTKVYDYRPGVREVISKEHPGRIVRQDVEDPARARSWVRWLGWGTLAALVAALAAARIHRSYRGA